ncbi:MAG: hypothetical protein JO051_01630 [Acidobacteriaceae bacterium]|nr:hypothetical protein [Acidobacteriaceae bacterium]
MIFVSPDDSEGLARAIGTVEPATPATNESLASGGRGASLSIGLAITGLTLTAVGAGLLYSPGRPPVELNRDALVIHSRFYGMTLPASGVDVANVRVVDLQAEAGWRPVARTGGFSNPFYRAGRFRTANGQTVMLFTTGSRRLVLIPPASKDGAPVLLDAADPAELVARIRQQWARQQGSSERD